MKARHPSCRNAAATTSENATMRKSVTGQVSTAEVTAFLSMDDHVRGDQLPGRGNASHNIVAASRMAKPDA